MKKLLCYTFITFCVMFMGMISVDAATLVPNPSVVNASTSSRDYTFVVAFSGANGWKLSYDSEVYPSGNSNPITNGSINSDSGSITFAVRKGLSLTSDKDVNITITNENSNETVSTKITIKANQSSQQTPQTTQSTTTTTQARSNNNNLSSISLTTNEGEQVDLSPSFSPNVYTYSATVASTAKTVSVDARMEDSRANLTINGDDDELVAGENNRITITVTAEDGTPRTYTINVTREALTADATLSELSIKESKSFKLEENKYTYNVKIGKNVKTLTLDYTPSDENATVEVDGNENLKDGSKVRITVTAEDGTKRVYTLNIVKETTTTKNANTDSIEVEKNPLIIMGLSVIAFGLIGGIIYVIRK